MGYRRQPSNSAFGLLACVAALLSLAANALPLRSVAALPAARELPEILSGELIPQIYLPLLAGIDSFDRSQPVWPQDGQPAAMEVAFFRYAFDLNETLGQARLSLFADTRYEAWLDGIFIGRGPARFSRLRHEYDVLPLNDLAPGIHLLAVLVEWAPNQRRSESLTPYLQASLEGMLAGEWAVIGRSGPSWKATLSTAWRSDAAAVHSWGLIGPTELLDLRRLPLDWMLPSFSDQGWSPAAVIDLSQANAISTTAASVPVPFTAPLPSAGALLAISPNSAPEPAALDPSGAIRYTPRSIPLLEDAPHPVSVLDAGYLSPGRAILELPSTLPDPYLLTITATQPVTFQLEALKPLPGSVSPAIQVDGQAPAWVAAGTGRPDVVLASHKLAAGSHRLSVASIPAGGATLSISTAGIQAGALPFQQGQHAGRRLLLAEPVPDKHAVAIDAGDTLSATFAQGATYLVLDAGHVLQGRLVAQVTGPAGTVVDIGLDERLYQGLRPLPHPGSLHAQWNQVDSWVLDGSTRPISTLDTRTGRYILVAIWGTGPVRLDGIQVVEERYPLQATGQFYSSDPLLNQIWEVGADTVSVNMGDAYADPWRERGQWWGDAFVDYHANLAAFGDTALLRRGLTFMADSIQNGPPTSLAPNGQGSYILDYGLLWIQSLKDGWQLTGDQALLQSTYGPLKNFLAFLRQLENPDTGLLDLLKGPYGHTALIDWAGADSRYGQSTALNALYYGSLQDAASLAEALGDRRQADAWRMQAMQLRQQANRLLYLPAQHRYLSSIFDGKSVPPSPHAQAWALAYGMVPGGEEEAVATSLLSLLAPNPQQPNLEIYGMYWALEGLGRAGQVSAGIDLVKRYYGDLIDRGATTWWETFTADRQYWAALSHGWGSAPTWFLTRYLLGASQTSPTTWSVQPAISAISAAGGILPLQNGSLHVQWETSGCQVTLAISAPPGTSGEALIPLQIPGGTIFLDGKPAWTAAGAQIAGISLSPAGVRLPLGSGQFIIQVEPSAPTCQAGSTQIAPR